jgi:3-dehydroquinate dehydratase II
MSSQMILILNGPNLNMLGIREPEVYGTTTLDDIRALCERAAEKLNLTIDFRQSNHEGDLIDWIHEAYHTKMAGVIINAAGYTHTSVAIHDALKILTCPVIDVHLTDPTTRESFRHINFIHPVAKAHFAGHGAQSYVLALEAMKALIG